jgi:PAS domain S-box-containing protein
MESRAVSGRPVRRFSLRGDRFRRQIPRAGSFPFPEVSVKAADGAPPEILAELLRARERISALESAAEARRERRLLGRMAEGFLAAAADGTVRRVNRAAASLLGGNPDRLAGRPLSAVLGSSLARAIWTAVGSEPEGTEVFISGTPSGCGRFLRARCFRDAEDLSIFLSPAAGPVFEPVSDSGVEPDSEPGTVPSRPDGEAVPEPQTLPYRELLETLPVIVVIHENRRIRFINSAGAEILGGGDPAEFIGRNVMEMVHPDSLSIVEKRLRNLGAGRINHLADIGIRLPDGRRRTVQAVSAPFAHEGGQAALLMAVDITARKAAEEELAAIFDNSQVGLVLLRNGRVVSRCNRRFAEILGWEDPDALTGLGVRAFHLSQDHFETFGRLHYQTLREGVQLQVDYPLRRKNGALVWCSLSGKALDTETPPDLDRGVLWVVEDISARRASEAALRRSERRFRTLVETMPYGVNELDVHGRIVFANSAHLAITGYSAEGLPSVFDLMPDAEDQNRLRRRMARGPDNHPSPETLILRNRTRNGKLVDVQIDWNFITDEAGTVTGYVSVVSDITRRKAAERAIQDSEERYRTLATHSPTGILLSDGETIRFANAAAARLLGADRPESLMGTPLLDRVHPEFHPQANQRIQTMLQMGRPVPPAEQRYLRLDGSAMPVEVVAVPLDLAEGRLIYSLFQDITERKAAEKALRASLREKEVLLREIHHRVKNNMAVIAGLLDMQLGQVSAPEVRRLLQDSRSRIGAMSLIHETLYRSENLAAVLLENYLKRLTGQLFSLYAPRSGSVTVEIDAPDIHLPAQQAVHVGLVTTELVTNALKYAFPDGRKGTLSIRSARRPDGWIDLRVRDDGAGFPPGFDPKTATTLGMRLVSLLVNRQLHGRWQWTQHDGVSFHLSWPAVAGGSKER